MSSGAGVLSGRKELLSWLNGLCNADYPTVESLRDGAAYCTIMEAAVSRIAQNCIATQAVEARIAERRAEHAASLLSKVDWTGTIAVCENGNPSRDNVSVQQTCLHNIGLLSDILQKCVPASFKHTIDVDRLASGKLQDHVQLLRWLYQFMSKVLVQYSRASLQKKLKRTSGMVEGVKLNRTALLRSTQASITGVPPLSSPAQEKPLGLQITLQQSEKETGRDSYSCFEAPFSGESPRKDTTAAQAPEYHSGDARLWSASASKELNVANEKTVASYYTQGAVTIPVNNKSSLTQIRNEVEELEALALNLQEYHFHQLTQVTHTSDITQKAKYVPRREVRKYLAEKGFVPPPQTILSLQDLGGLLEERDVLAQRYAALDLLVSRTANSTLEDGQGPSRLLQNILDLLRPV